MKLLIAGSRGINDINLSDYIDFEVDMIISGGANGVDMLAEEYADKNKISKMILRPDYRRYKRGAPLKRNELMIMEADMVMAFWDGVSSGTKYTIDYAKKIGKDVIITIINIH